MHTNMQLNSKRQSDGMLNKKSAAKKCLPAEPLGTFCYAH